MLERKYGGVALRARIHFHQRRTEWATLTSQMRLQRLAIRKLHHKQLSCGIACSECARHTAINNETAAYKICKLLIYAIIVFEMVLFIKLRY